VEPDPQRDAAPAPNLMSNIGGLSKMSQSITISYFSHSMLYQFKSKEIRRKYYPYSYVNFGLFYKNWLVI
jgi:hypothetical protein